MDKDSHKKTSSISPKKEVKKEVKKEEPKKEIVGKSPSLKEAYPTIENLKNALRRADEGQLKQIASIAKSKSNDRDEILNIWRNS